VLTNCLPAERGDSMKSSLKNNKKNLTKTVVDALTLPEKSPIFIWDTKLKNFGIKLNPTGKVFIVQSRVNGQSIRVKIGDYGTFTVDEARKMAKQLLLDMANGSNPNEQKKIKEAQAITLEMVVEDYIKDRTLKDSSIRDIFKHLNGTFKEWKGQPIAAITRDMVLKLFRKRSGESPAQANQAFRNLRALINYAMETYRPGNEPISSENPVNVISGAKIWNVIKPKNRRIPLDKVGQALIILESLQADPAQTMAGRSMTDAVIFCLLTGARWGEVQTLVWDNVNTEALAWSIIDPKNTIPVTLPLSNQAQELLENRPRMEGNNFVFCSNKSSTGHIGPGRFVTDQLTKALKVELSPHDLRRTFRSIAAELNIELWRTKLLMNHKMGNDITIAAYTEKEDLEYLRPSIQAIGDWVERQGELEKNKIIDINIAREVV
jgi:integrase